MNSSTIDPNRKVQSEHLERLAYVYIRQSSKKQVEQNLESKRRQYNLVEWALELGWPKERIVVVDNDQGKSGAFPGMRTGFGEVITGVARGDAGIVLSLEASRLARNSPDWHHLLYLCRFTNTLMADEEAIYDLSLSSDRMVLGFRGQMSEMEYDTAIHRMVEARWSKARRGEFLTVPPAGYDVDELGQLVLTSNEAIQTAIRTVYSKFDELGAARQVFVWWRDNQMEFPVRRVQLHGHPVVWVAPRYRMFRETLRNPIYAGAYVFGKTKRVREIDPTDPRKLKIRSKRVLREDWPVLIKDNHPAYISFEKYIENCERMRSNSVMKPRNGESKKGPAREGRALLQGLVRCGQCGRRMYVSYGGTRPTNRGGTVQYRCCVARQDQPGPDCQLVGGKQIEKVVVQAFLEATAPAGIEAAVLADAQVRRESEAVERQWQLQIEKATYEAQRAERQYNATEPENRIVARELERRWNRRLEEVEAVRAKAQAALQEHNPLTALEMERARQLGADLETIWNAETTTNGDRKRLLRSIIEEVQIRSEEEHYAVHVVWKGGLATEHEVRRFRKGKWNVTPEETVGLVRKLACEFDDTQIARILNKQGRKSGPGNTFTKAVVYTLRWKHGIPACPERPARDPRDGPFTADEAAAELGISVTTIHRWLRDGVLAGKQLTPGAPWQIVLTDEIRRRLTGGDAPAGWVGLTEAARRLGLGKSHVAQLVNAGKLPAVRTKVGKRTVWRIDVSSTDCGKQNDLFDQMTTKDSEEA